MNSFYRIISAPFTCEHEGKRYRTFDKFTSGIDGCVQCICIDGRVNCDDSKCQTILVDPPESITEPTKVKSPPIATTTTTTTTTHAPIVQSRGSEKGPSPADLSYYASRLTDVNFNSDKGPNTDAMSYSPEQYHYLQAQIASPGLRGPPGPPGKRKLNESSFTMKYVVRKKFSFERKIQFLNGK